MNHLKNLRLTKKSFIYLAGLNALLALFTLLLNQEFQPIRLIALGSFTIFILLLWNKFDNILFFTRTLFLGGIGYFPMVVKIILGPYAYFSGYEKRTQEFDVVVLMYVATSLALLGNEIGLYLGAGQKKNSFRQSLTFEMSFWKIIFIFSIPIILWASLVSIKSAGQSVLSASYGSTVGQEFYLGNTVAVGIISLLAMWVAILKHHIKFGMVIFVVSALFFLVYSQFLMGYRQDVLTPLLGMAICYGLVKNTAFQLKAKIFICIFVLLIVFEMWGLARQTFAVTRMSLTDMAVIVFTNTFNPDIVQFGTVSPIATTFSNMVWLIETKRMDFTWGQSYWEFILRTPPAFLYPERPADYAWIFGEYGLQAEGGFFELAEAYMNFGLPGAFLIPAIISFLLSKAFFNTMRKQTVFSYFLLFTFLGVFFRGTWYQTFAFYKSFLTILVLYTIFLVVYQNIAGALRNSYSIYRLRIKTQPKKQTI